MFGKGKVLINSVNRKKLLCVFMLVVENISKKSAYLISKYSLEAIMESLFKVESILHN